MATAGLITFGVISLTEDEILYAEELYEGVDPSLTFEEIPSSIVSSSTEEIYTLSANEEVLWKVQA